jgi:sulfoxide reductase heme-binding subunit YedZ
MHGTAPPRVAAWQLWRDRRGRLSWLRLAVLALLLFPLAKALLEYDAIFYGARPLINLIHRAGFWTLVFLGVTLAVTPFRQVARYGALVDIRRMIGVGTFCYAAAHLSLFVADQQFDLGKVVHEITHRVYLVIGFTAWLGLGVLAITSTDRMHRRLGPFRWRRLHQIIYAIALLALIHYFQQTKADVTVPVFASSLFGWLILYRVLAWWQDTNELSPLSLTLLAFAVATLTFFGEAFGIAIAFHVSPMRVLETVFDLDVGIRPGWQVLAAGLLVVAVDSVRGWQDARLRKRKVKRKAVA